MSKDNLESDMNAQSQHNITDTAEEMRSRLFMEGFLQESLGHSVKIQKMTREPNRYTTLFSAEVLSLTLEDGTGLAIFLKHLGSEESDHPDKQCRDREIRVYEELFRDSNLPIAKCYGARWNDESKKRELFLEYIDDWRLEYQEYDHWITAARRLAHLHSYFAQRVDKLLNCNFLLRLDGAYLHQWAYRALDAVANQSTELANKVAAVLDKYERVIDIFTRQPLTLVHNDLAPQNVLVDRSRVPARIQFVDWEMAGVGFGLMDLVRLKYGTDVATDQRIKDAYFQGWEDSGCDRLHEDALRGEFAACELHKTIYFLAHSQIRGSSAERVANWVEEAQQFSRQALDS